MEKGVLQPGHKGLRVEEYQMKRHILFSTVCILATWSAATASNAQFTINLPGFGLSLPAPPGVGINIGLPVAPAAPYPYQPAAATPAYPYDYETLEMDAPPDFVEPPELGFYVAVGVPFDLFFFNNVYYLYRDNYWYSSYYYNGPWRGVSSNHVPYALHRYPFDRIHHYRDNYYGQYRRYGSWNGQRHFTPGAHAEGRDGYGRSGYGYARPNSSSRVYGDRTSYNRPAAPGYDNRSRSSYGRTNSGPTHYYGSRPDAARPSSPAQSHGNRAANYRQDRPTQSFTGRPSFSRPDNTGQGFGNRPAYTRPYGQTQGLGNRATYSRPTNTNQGFGNRPSFSRPNSTGQVFSSSPAYSRPETARQNSGNRPAFSRSQGPVQGNTAGNAGHGYGGFGNGGFGGRDRGR